MNKKILVCGDSFCIEDPRYPGLHFTDKIKNKYQVDIINQSAGGASNSMIAVQFLHSMNLFIFLQLWYQDEFLSYK